MYVREAGKDTVNVNYDAMYRENYICISYVFNGFIYIICLVTASKARLE